MRTDAVNDGVKENEVDQKKLALQKRVEQKQTASRCAKQMKEEVSGMDSQKLPSFVHQDQEGNLTLDNQAQIAHFIVTDNPEKYKERQTGYNMSQHNKEEVKVVESTFKKMDDLSKGKEVEFTEKEEKEKKKVDDMMGRSDGGKRVNKYRAVQEKNIKAQKEDEEKGTVKEDMFYLELSGINYKEKGLNTVVYSSSDPVRANYNEELGISGSYGAHPIAIGVNNVGPIDKEPAAKKATKSEGYDFSVGKKSKVTSEKVINAGNNADTFLHAKSCKYANVLVKGQEGMVMTGCVMDGLHVDTYQTKALMIKDCKAKDVEISSSNLDPNKVGAASMQVVVEGMKAEHVHIKKGVNFDSSLLDFSGVDKVTIDPGVNMKNSVIVCNPQRLEAKGVNFEGCLIKSPGIGVKSFDKEFKEGNNFHDKNHIHAMGKEQGIYNIKLSSQQNIEGGAKIEIDTIKMIGDVDMVVKGSNVGTVSVVHDKAGKGKDKDGIVVADNHRMGTIEIDGVNIEKSEKLRLRKHKEPLVISGNKSVGNLSITGSTISDMDLKGNDISKMEVKDSIIGNDTKKITIDMSQVKDQAVIQNSTFSNVTFLNVDPAKLKIDANNKFDDKCQFKDKDGNDISIQNLCSSKLQRAMSQSSMKGTLKGGRDSISTGSRASISIRDSIRKGNDKAVETTGGTVEAPGFRASKRQSISMAAMNFANAITQSNKNKDIGGESGRGLLESFEEIAVDEKSKNKPPQQPPSPNSKGRG